MNRKLFSGLTTLVIGGLLMVGFLQRQYLKDYYIVKSSTLSSESSQLESELDLTEDASFLYKASQPKIQNSANFNNSCKSVSHEHSIVLGCYSRQQIYIFDVKDERLNGVKEVTAAHELLHAAYERTSTKEKETLNKQLTATAESIEDQRFKDTLSEYRRSEPDQIANELHSILGTEIKVLPSGLEEHYQKYFNDRSKIVSFAEQYESAFTNLESEIDSYDKQLEDLRSEKESLENSLESQQRLLQLKKESLDRLESTGSASAYNAAVSSYNADIQRYNATIAQLKTLVETFNDIVAKRNALAATQNDLVKQLDSSYAPIQ